MCHLDQLAHDVQVGARHVDTEARPQEKSIAGENQVDLGIDSRMGRQLDFLPSGSKLDRADKAGRPSGGEKLFRGRVWLGQLDIDRAVATARVAVLAAGGVSLASAKDLFSHD